MKNKIINEMQKMEAIKIDTVNQFTWTSGIKSPIYIDNRLTIGNYDLRTKINLELTKIIQKNLMANYYLQQFQSQPK
jgi:orotate phosphoribosyltransferase